MSKFAIEFSAAAAINDILALRDTFKNSGNYGLVFDKTYCTHSEENKNQKEPHERTDITMIEDYKIMFIDHLPDANNGILSQLYSYKINNYSKIFYISFFNKKLSILIII